MAGVAGFGGRHCAPCRERDPAVLTHPDIAQTQLVVFLLETRRCGLPLSAVDRVLPIVEVEPLPGAPEVLAGVINYHGAVIPVVDLRARLGLARREPRLTDRLLLVRTRSRSLALVVDAVPGLAAVNAGAVRDRSTLDPSLRDVAGVAALDDGLMVIQDLEALLSDDEERALERALREVGE